MSFSKVSLKSTIILGSLLAATVGRGALDLSPTITEYSAEGIKYHQLVFHDDKQRVEYEPPPAWKFEGGSNQLRLIPPQKFAEAMISVTPLNKPQAFDENTIKLLQEQLVGALPVGSQFAKIEASTANSVLVAGNETLEITVSYQWMGEKFVKSALFANLKNAQLVFRLTAKKNDFASLARDLKTSIFSWHWVVEKSTDATAPASDASS